MFGSGFYIAVNSCMYGHVERVSSTHLTDHLNMTIAVDWDVNGYVEKGKMWCINEMSCLCSLINMYMFGRCLNVFCRLVAARFVIM